MEYIKPAGCRAAVTTGWEYGKGTYKLTARMVCGERINVSEGSFGRAIFDLDTARASRVTEEKVSSDVTETLGAMCLGCPHNTETAQARTETQS